MLKCPTCGEFTLRRTRCRIVGKADHAHFRCTEPTCNVHFVAPFATVPKHCVECEQTMPGDRRSDLCSDCLSHSKAFNPTPEQIAAECQLIQSERINQIDKIPGEVYQPRIYADPKRSYRRY